MENMSEIYAEKLKKIMFAGGFSQENLAGKLGVSFVTLNGWINGKSEPRATAKEKIDLFFAEILGADEAERDEISKIKAEALKKKCTVTKIIKNRELLNKVTTTLTYHNNATEGSTMTEKDVEEVIFNNKVLKNRTANEQKEAINHQSALYFLLDELSEKGKNFEFTPEIVKMVHLRMMNGIISDAGYFRNHGVRIRGASVALANYARVPELLADWCNVANEETFDVIEKMARLHAEFERIHPFSDGNGRTGRLLLFIFALKNGVIPPILKKERRYAYYKYLEMAQTRQETDLLEKYIAEAMLETAEMMESL